MFILELNESLSLDAADLDALAGRHRLRPGAFGTRITIP